MGTGGWTERARGIKHEEERIKEVFEVVHCLNLTAPGWQSLNGMDEEMRGWMGGCREEAGTGYSSMRMNEDRLMRWQRIKEIIDK